MLIQAWALPRLLHLEVFLHPFLKVVDRAVGLTGDYQAGELVLPGLQFKRHRAGRPRTDVLHLAHDVISTRARLQDVQLMYLLAGRSSPRT